MFECLRILRGHLRTILNNLAVSGTISEQSGTIGQFVQICRLHCRWLPPHCLISTGWSIIIILSLHLLYLFYWSTILPPLLLARFSQWERIVTQNIITDRQYKRARMWIVSLLVLSNSIFDIFDNLWMIWLSGNNWPWLRLLRQIVFCICSQWQCTETMSTVNDANWFIKLQSGEFCMVLSCIVQWTPKNKHVDAD